MMVAVTPWLLHNECINGVEYVFCTVVLVFGRECVRYTDMGVSNKVCVYGCIGDM